MEETPPKPFRAIIVGGGIIGLSLSHAFQLGNIDHVVLEKHDKIITVRGAAMLIWPGAARIFDQFGILDKILAAATPIMHEYRRWPDGSILGVNDTFKMFGSLYVDFGFSLRHLVRILFITLSMLQIWHRYHLIRPPCLCHISLRWAARHIKGAYK